LSGKDYIKNSLRKSLYTFIEENDLEIFEIVEEVIGGNMPTDKRIKFAALIDELRKNDYLITCKRLDLGRSYEEVIETLNQLSEKQVSLCILELPFFNDWNYIIDKRLYKTVLKLLIQNLEELSGLNKQYKSNSTKSGMKKVAEEGVKHIGHPVVEVPESFKKNYRKYKDGVYGGMSLPDFCRMNKISKTCYYNWIKKMKKAGEI